MTNQDELRAAAERLKADSYLEDQRAKYPSASHLVLSEIADDFRRADEQAISRYYLATLTPEPISVEALVKRGFEKEFDLIEGQRLKHCKTLLWVELRRDEKPRWPPYIGCLRPQHMADVDWILSRLARG